MQSMGYVDPPQWAEKRIHAAAYVKAWAAKGSAEKTLAEISMEERSKAFYFLKIRNRI